MLNGSVLKNNRQQLQSIFTEEQLMQALLFVEYLNCPNLNHLSAIT